MRQLKAGLLLLLSFFYNRGQDVQNRLFYKVKQIMVIESLFQTKCVSFQKSQKILFFQCSLKANLGMSTRIKKSFQSDTRFYKEIKLKQECLKPQCVHKLIFKGDFDRKMYESLSRLCIKCHIIMAIITRK